MTDIDRLYERLRAVDPASDLDRDPDSALARRVRHHAGTQGPRAETAQGPGHGPLWSRGPSVRRLAVTVGVSLLMLSGAAALASGVFQPDPTDVADILSEAEEAGRHAVKNEGWRPTLRTEEVWCVAEDGTVGSGRSYDFDLDQEMTEADLLDACLDGSDQVRGLDVGVGDYTVCEAVGSSEHVQGMLDEPAFVSSVIEGDLTSDRPGFPVVLGWQADCGETTIDANRPEVELRPLASLAAVNRAREVEIGLTAAALQECLTLEQAEAMAHQADAELSGDWLIVESAGAATCYRVWVQANYGILSIGPPG